MDSTAKSIIALIAISTVIGSLLIVDYSSVVLRNGDIEEGTGLSPRFYWTYNPTGGAVFTWTEAEVHNGTKALKTEQNNDGISCWGQTIVWTASAIANFTFSTYIKTDFNSSSGFDGGGFIALEMYNETWGYLGAIDSLHVTTTTDWAELTSTGTLFTNSHYLTLTWVMKNITGSVYFDDTSIAFTE